MEETGERERIKKKNKEEEEEEEEKEEEKEELFLIYRAKGQNGVVTTSCHEDTCGAHRKNNNVKSPKLRNGGEGEGERGRGKQHPFKISRRGRWPFDATV